MAFKAKGQWIVNFDYGQHGNFTAGGKGGAAGYNGKEDEFNASNRVRVGLEAVASENLSGTVFFEIGSQTWGKAGDGGALGADGNSVVKVKHAYLDWMIPQTDAKVRMGIQPLALPGAATPSQIFDTDVAGVAVSYKFNDNVAATAFWARLFNDNGGYDSSAAVAANTTNNQKSRAGLMDNVDMFALAVPVTLDGVKVTPFAAYMAMGPGALSSVKRGDNLAGISGGKEDRFFKQGMLPLGGAFHKDGTKKSKLVNSYGNAWWAGLAAELTMFDPLRVAADFNYGSSTWADNAAWNRAGWLADLLVEYKMDWGTPGIYGWYSSGDDDNPANGSERMPVIDNNTGDTQFGYYAFNGAPGYTRQNVVGDSVVGTWGIGARIKDVSFVEDLKHMLMVSYIQGTNSPKMLKKANGYYGSADPLFQPFYQNAGGIGAQGLYMTTDDSIVEVTLRNDYKIYENLNMILSGSYLFTSVGRNSMATVNGGKRHDIKDPWHVNLQFVYSF